MFSSRPTLACQVLLSSLHCVVACIIAVYVGVASIVPYVGAACKHTHAVLHRVFRWPVH